MTPDRITSPYASMSFNTVSAAPVPHALTELDHPFVVAVDRFGTVYVADLAGQLQPGRLQYRFISADYPTAGQKRRLTTRHRP